MTLEGLRGLERLGGSEGFGGVDFWLIFDENSLWKWSWRSLGAGIGSKRLPERYQRGWMVQKSAQKGEQRRP